MLAMVDNPDHSRAREAVTVEARVDLICEWMARGRYEKGKTDRELSRVWSVDVRTVRNYSAEARRLLARELTSRSRDELLAELLARVSFIGQDALQRTEEVVSVKGEVVEVRRPDHRTALRAAEATGELLGLKIQRHHHTVTAGEMTTDEILAQLNAHGVRVEMPRLTEGTEVADGDTAKSPGKDEAG